MGKIANANAQIFTYRAQELQNWRLQAINYRKAQYDNPFSERQRGQIENQGLNPEAFINVFAATNESFVGTLMSNKSSFSVAPKVKNTPKAYLWQAVILDILKKSYFPKIKKRALDDMINVGIGFLGVDAAPPWRPNIYNTVVKYIDFENCLWPTTYDDPFMQDAEDFIYFCDMSVQSLIVKTGEKYDPKMRANVIREMTSTPDTLKRSKLFNTSFGGAEENQLCFYIEVFKKEWKNYVDLIDYENGEPEKKFRFEYNDAVSMSDNVMSFFIDKGGNNEKSKTLAQQYLSDEKRIKPLKQIRCVKYRSAGCYDFKPEEIPTKYIPIVPLSYKDVQGANPIGVYTQFGGLNKMINQALFLEFLTAKKNASTHWKLPQNSVRDEKEFTEQISTLNGVIRTTPQTLGSGSVSEPEPVTYQAPAGAMLQMIPFIEERIKDGIGMDDILMGTYSGTPPSGDAVEQLQRYGGIRLTQYAVNDQMAMAQLAEIIHDYAKERSDFDKVTTMFIGDDSLYSNLLQSNVAEDMGNNRVVIPINRRENNIIKNSLKAEDDDIEIEYVAAPFMETHRKQLQAGLSMMMQQGGPDVVSAISPFFFQVMDIPQAHAIASQINTQQQLLEQISALKEDLRKSNDEVKNISQQLIRSTTRTEVTRESQRFKSIMETLRNDFTLAVKEGKIDQEIADENINKLEKVMDDLSKILFNQNPPEETVDNLYGGQS